MLGGPATIPAFACRGRRGSAGGYVVEAATASKLQRRGLDRAAGRAPASLAEEIIEPRHDAVAAQPDAVAFQRCRHDAGGDRSIDVIAAAEIGVHEFQDERNAESDFVISAELEVHTSEL